MNQIPIPSAAESTPGGHSALSRAQGVLNELGFLARTMEAAHNSIAAQELKTAAKHVAKAQQAMNR